MKGILKVSCGLFMLAILLVACGGGGGGSSDSTPTYTVTYDGNGAIAGTVPTDSANYTQGQVVTVLGNPGNLVKTHYNFAGWNTKADGSGANYAQGQTFQMGSADVTLYAKWAANPIYAVTYDGNGATSGTPPADTNPYEQGFIVTVLGNPGNLIKTHFTFAGWNTQADGSGTTYAQGQTFTMGSADVTLYAKWSANPTYTVTYDGNGNTGGTAPVDNTNYEEGQTVTVPGNPGVLVKTHFDFAGWNTQADGNGTTYGQGATFAMGMSDVILFAKWTAKPTYTVTYNGNGATSGSAPLDSTNYEEGDTVTVLDNTGNLGRTNYSFAGWNTEADGTGTTYAKDDTFLMGTSNVTLYAKWNFGGPYVADANTVLLDHFDGSLTSPGAIYGYEGPTHTCDAETFIAGGLTPVFVQGQSGFGQALSLSPPAGHPNGAAFLEYYDGGGTYRNILNIPNGTLEFLVFLSSYGASGLDLVDQLPYYSVCYDATFTLAMSSAGVLSASFNNGAFSMNSGAATVPLNTWTHVAVTWGSTGAKLYINGAQVGGNASTSSPASGGNVELSFRLGTEAGVTTLMDELRVSNIQRTW